MRVSCFTFLKNAHLLGYPFVESIRSALPLCDEYVVNIGECEDDTVEMVEAIGSPKIRIIRSQWNENMRTKGFVYGQQKSIALYNCSGDWAFYLEADEVIHEDEIPAIRTAMEKHLHDERIEALVFDFIHFYGNHGTYAFSPAWYRRETRIIRNTIRAYAPDGLFFVVLDAGSNKKGRYPRAALAHARIFHYGWLRSQEQMNEKSNRVAKYWGQKNAEIDYAQIDSGILREFTGSHPKVMSGWIPDGPVPVFKADAAYQLSGREKRHRIMKKLEDFFGADFTKKHYRLVR
ncbi:MAG: glycosyltransferase [Thermodesulfovibrio sp.]|nr:glycosyltransferase [Thermodesulfovibrio sp.]